MWFTGTHATNPFQFETCKNPDQLHVYSPTLYNLSVPASVGVTMCVLSSSTDFFDAGGAFFVSPYNLSIIKNNIIK